MANLQKYSLTVYLIVFVISLFLTIPIFIIGKAGITNYDWVFNLDRILLFIFIFVMLFVILHILRFIAILVFIIFLSVFTYNSFSGGYGFGAFLDDYRDLMYAMENSENPMLGAQYQMKSIDIKKSIDYMSPAVRKYAVKLAGKYEFYTINGKDYSKIAQSFAIFKEIRRNWTYVSDPKNKEYFEKASEAIEYLSGDCDDYSIVMAACITSIGGTVRLIMIEGHIFPELLIGKKEDCEQVRDIIQGMFNIEEGDDIYFHESRNNIWINLDYTEQYPGGYFVEGDIIRKLYVE